MLNNHATKKHDDITASYNIVKIIPKYSQLVNESDTDEITPDNDSLHVSFLSKKSYENNNNNVLTRAKQRRLCSVEMDDLIIVKRSMIRDNGMMGHDYSIQHVLNDALSVQKMHKRFWCMSVIRDMCTFILFIMMMIFSFYGLSTVDTMLSPAGMLNCSILCAMLVLVTFIARNIMLLIKERRKDWNFTSSFSRFSFAPDDGENRDPFRRIGIMWNYTQESYVNDQVAKVFEKYILALDDKKLDALIAIGEHKNHGFNDDPDHNYFHAEALKSSQEFGYLLQQLVIKEYVQNNS